MIDSILKVAFSFLLSTCVSWAQWEVLQVPSVANLRSVFTVNEKVAWAGGSKGTLLRTLDGGVTWKQIPIADSDSLDFRDVHAFSESEIVAMSIGEAEKGKSRIYRSSDGGETWHLVFQTYQKGVFLNCISFWDNQNGICLGDPIDGRFYMLRTTDGGKSWHEFSFASRPEAMLGEYVFAASGTSLQTFGSSGVVIGTGGIDNARIIRSNDMGNTWKAVKTSMQASKVSGIFGITFNSNYEGIALGGDYKNFKGVYPNALFTTNGGKSWKAKSLITPNGLKEAAAYLPSGEIIVVGHSGSALSSDKGKTWTILDTRPYHSIHFKDGTGYAVGVDGLISRYTTTKNTSN